MMHIEGCALQLPPGCALRQAQGPHLFLTFWNKAVPEPFVLAVPEPVVLAVPEPVEGSLSIIIPLTIKLTFNYVYICIHICKVNFNHEKTLINSCYGLNKH
jgi:hypothetical protein